jgi:predicted heme/steroid binding protein
MKKFLSLLSLILVFALVACADDTPAPSVPIPTPEEPSEVDDQAVDASEDGDLTPPSTDPDSATDDPYDDPILPSDGSEDDGYGSGESSEPSAPEDELDTDENGQLLMTLNQLSQFDGKDGRRAFIAVDGVVYEVTQSPRWRNGIHNGDSSIAAGNDLTSQIDAISPHGRRVLDNIPRVGKIIEE